MRLLNKSHPIVRDILDYYKGHYGQAIYSIFASVILDSLDLFMFYAMGQLIQGISLGSLDPIFQSLPTLFGFPGTFENSMGALLIMVFITQVAFDPVYQWLTWWHHWGIALEARRKNTRIAIKKVLELPLSYFEKHNPGRITSRIVRGIDNHMFLYPDAAGLAVPKSIRIFAIFIVISCINLPIGLFGFITFALVLGYCTRSLVRLVQQETLMDKHFETTQGRLSEIVTNIKTVKSYAKEFEEFNAQGKRVDRSFKYIIYRIHKSYCVIASVRKTFIRSCSFSILLYALWLVFQKSLDLSDFIVVATLTSFAYSELEPLCYFIEQVARRYAPILQFHEFLNTPLKEDNDFTHESKPLVSEGNISFNNVTFTYNEHAPILNDFSLTIRSKETIGIVGYSGSGKTTLIKLLMRYFEPQKGNITLDGKDINTYALPEFRKSFAIVHQEVDIFNRTLWENLTYGMQEPIDPLKVAEVCKMAYLDDVLEALPQGMETLLDERGARLSGGQRQRIGIARALLANPAVLIFDEATSNLDYESESLIQKAMENIMGQCTVIIIAHRLMTVKKANRIVVLSHGHIEQEGTHESLLSIPGIYQKLHQLSQ